MIRKIRAFVSRVAFSKYAKLDKFVLINDNDTISQTDEGPLHSACMYRRRFLTTDESDFPDRPLRSR